MKKPNLIILEGPDGIGKTTQAKLLADKLGYKFKRQPSSDNMISSIRDYVMSGGLTPEESQLFLGFSHIVDAFEMAQSGENIVMDRCYFSGIVYGGRTNANQNKLREIIKNLKTVYGNTIGKSHNIDIVFMDADERFDSTDDDAFEKNTKWEDLKLSYNRMAEGQIFEGENVDCYFNEDESIYKFYTSKEDGIERTNIKLITSLGL